MPGLEKKRLPVLTAEQLRQILKACYVKDKAIILFMVDSGLRRAETINLNWGDEGWFSDAQRERVGSH
jgi:integrase